MKIAKNSEYRTFVTDIKKRILKSQYEALKAAIRSITMARLNAATRTCLTNGIC